MKYRIYARSKHTTVKLCNTHNCFAMGKTRLKDIQSRVTTTVIVLGMLTISFAYILYDLGYFSTPFNQTSRYLFFTAVHWLSIVENDAEIALILGPLGSKVRETLLNSFYMSLVFHIFFHLFSTFQVLLFKMVLDHKKRRPWPFLGEFGFKASMYISFCGLGAALTEQYALKGIYQKDPTKVDEHLYLLLYFFGRFRYLCIFTQSFSYGMVMMEFVEWPRKRSYFSYVRFFSGRQLNLPLIYLGSSFLGILSLCMTGLRSGLELCMLLNMFGVFGTVYFATSAFTDLVVEGPEKPKKSQ